VPSLLATLAFGQLKRAEQARHLRNHGASSSHRGVAVGYLGL
jgi:hypothetical protein